MFSVSNPEFCGTLTYKNILLINYLDCRSRNSQEIISLIIPSKTEFKKRIVEKDKTTDQDNVSSCI
jgi:hypothetical protein